ncbi:M56 family metallopeptidase [Pseudoxanthomonas suwonensis]|uniref:Peptidase M56 domain-containing protein n=1 Tax=Pseudoxanthomonas suwonensis TaxID=314722 RepID=A0A0E3Z2U4_9GAMM|nr:M56 family metallopeptidase [Pseudoxanthomonas suwonensis]AKC87964.1 hypothetical protein WQ53_15520 [Pseudoxanthomonas suwonensis]
MHESIAGLVPILGRALLHFLWQGALIGLLAALALQLLRDARPQLRYAVACLALLACVLAPMAYVAWASMDAPAAMASASKAAAATEAGATGLVVALALLPVGQAVQGLESLLPRLVLLWAAGACTLSLRLALGVWWIGRLPVLSAPHLQRKWQARLDALGTRLGVRRAVELRLAMTLDSPVVAGWWRPVVLVPAALLARMPVDYLEALLAHELAHVRRHDYLVNLLQGVAEALLFYHPVTWWLSRRIRLEREQVADRLAADAIGEPRRLAVALAALADEQAALRAVPQPALTALGPPGGHLVKRIEQLVAPGRAASGGRFVFPLLGLAAAGLAFYAQAQRELATTVPAASVATAPATATTPLEAEAPAISGVVAATAHAPATPAPAPRATAAVQAAPVAAPAAAASPGGAPVVSAPPAPPTPPSRAVPAPPPPPAVPSAGTVPAPPAPPATPSARPVPAPPAPPRPPAVAQVRHHGAAGEPYALVRRGSEAYLMSGSSDDMPQIEAARRSLDGDFFWFRRNGQAYVVTDPAVLSRVGRSWSQADALGERMRVLGQEMEGHGRKMETIGREMEKVAGAARPPAGFEAAARQMETLGRQQGGIGERQARLALAMIGADDQRQAELQRQMQALEREQAALSRKMEAQSRQLEAEAGRHQRQMQPMEALSRQMEEASKPMDALGRQMDGLGRQMDEASQRAERETRQLIAESFDKGLAKPLPQRQ